ncbi:unnamed protein product [Periconia digitata]|uniref:ACB domain-containing protein n=1 Tax=Periconia digitata TaxID=1303443 RepID=A0A9W4UKT4_9PLEO|nr:unnamed protein product [Periconia digitata]
MPSAKFDEVYKKTRDIKSGPSNDELLNVRLISRNLLCCYPLVPVTDIITLQLYAYAKVAQGEDIEKAPKPGMMDFTGKAKRKRWQEVVDAGTSQADAEKKYIELGEGLIKTHG